MRFAHVILILGVVLAGVGCMERRPPFLLVTEFEDATNVYYGADIMGAERALQRFVERVENDIEYAKRDPEGDYRIFLGMAWLRLASIYEKKGDLNKLDQALAAAINYFDEAQNFANDPRYQRDKRSSLLEFLDKIESERSPLWKIEKRRQP